MPECLQADPHTQEPNRSKKKTLQKLGIHIKLLLVISEAFFIYCRSVRSEESSDLNLVLFESSFRFQNLIDDLLLK